MHDLSTNTAPLSIGETEHFAVKKVTNNNNVANNNDAARRGKRDNEADSRTKPTSQTNAVSVFERPDNNNINKGQRKLSVSLQTRRGTKHKERSKLDGRSPLTGHKQFKTQDNATKETQRDDSANLLLYNGRAGYVAIYLLTADPFTALQLNLFATLRFFCTSTRAPKQRSSYKVTFIS